MSAIVFSVAVRGAVRLVLPALSKRSMLGVGRARRSTLPLAVRGKADRKTKADGSIKAGNFSLAKWFSSPDVSRALLTGKI